LLAAVGMDRSARQTFDFYRLLRNSVHNNSVHFGTSQTVAWRDAQYAFVEGRAIDSLTWEVMFTLLSDVSGMTAQIVVHPIIAAVPSIKDPYAA
jgi:hypothetical protein